MRLARLALLILLAALILPATVSTEPNTRDTRLLAQPATNGTHVAFVYADDLWVAKLDGTDVRRLTTDDGVESRPAFSPDGTLIAFSAQYDGNIDVFVVPAAGGVPKRLTWHPGADIVQGFTPDGKPVLFTSGRAAFTGALPAALHRARRGRHRGAAAHPERVPGGLLARRHGASPTTRCRRRSTSGSTTAAARVSRIWLFNTADHAVEKVPQPAGRANDVDPMWIGGTVYFRSDRDGEFNLYAYDTDVEAGPAAHDARRLPGAQRLGRRRQDRLRAGRLAAPPRPGHADRAKRLVDRRAGRPARDRGPASRRAPTYIRNAGLSPSGARAVFEFRGEIVTVPAEKGDPRNLTSTPAAHERSPHWSPDGKSHRLLLRRVGRVRAARRRAGRQGRREEVSSSPAPASTSAPRWSPDSKKIAFADNSQSRLLARPGDRRAMKRIGGNRLYSPDQPARRSPGRPTRSGSPTPSNTQPLVTHRVRLLARPGQVVRRSPTA